MTTVKEQIIEFYLKLNKKGRLIRKLEPITGTKYNTMKNWWFSESGGYSIPDKFQETVLEEILKEYAEQIK